MERLLTIKDIVEIEQSSRSHVYRGIASGRLPKPIMIGDASPRFRESEYLAKLDAAPRAKYTSQDKAA